MHTKWTILHVTRWKSHYFLLGQHLILVPNEHFQLQVPAAVAVQVVD